MFNVNLTEYFEAFCDLLQIEVSMLGIVLLKKLWYYTMTQKFSPLLVFV